jgi:hypothetical protein
VSRYLALDAEQGHLYVASVIVKGSAIKVEKALTLPDAGVLTPTNAVELGRRLKEAIKEAGIPPAPALISVGRERVVLKEIKYPASVTPADEPALIRFQVAKELAESGESVVIDYFALPTPDPDGQRRALAFAVRKDVLNAAKAAATAAGLWIAAVTPRPFGIAASLMRAIKDGAVTPPESPTAPVAILVRGDKWGELVILRGGHVAFTRSLTGMALNAEAAMIGEIRRNLAVFAQSQGAVQGLFVAEGEMPGGWTGRVRAGLTIPVQAFDPIAGVESDVPPETRGCFAGLAGLAALRARSAELPVNFLSPREPKKASDPGKRMIGWVAAAASILFVSGLAFGLYKLDEKDQTQRGLQNEKTDLEDSLRKLDEVSKRVKAVQDWEGKGVNWLDEIYDVTAAFPDPAKTEVIELDGQYVDPPKGAAKKYSAKMKLTIFTDASNPRAVSGHLSTNLSLDRHREVAMVQAMGSAGRGMDKYNVEMTIQRADPTRYTLKIDEPPMLKRPEKSDGKIDFGGFGGGFGGFDGMGGFGDDGAGGFGQDGVIPQRPQGKGGAGRPGGKGKGGPGGKQ